MLRHDRKLYWKSVRKENGWHRPMPSIDLSDYSPVLKQKDGIWSVNFNADISYPEDSHDICFNMENDSFWFAHRNNCIIETFRKHHSDGIIIDVGGGNGYVTKRLEDEGFQAVLVEPGIQGVANARKRGVQNIVHATLEDAGFKPGRIGGICLFDVIEHLPDETCILNTVRTLLKEDGRLYVTVPAFKFLWSSIDDYSGHYHRYTLKSLCNLLERCGFKVLYKTYFFSILPLPQFLLRVLPEWLKISKGHNVSMYHNQGKISSNLLNLVWRREIKRLSKGSTILFGSSCMVVATPDARNT